MSFKETPYGKIPEGWNFISASDYCSRITDGTHDSPKRKESGKFLITSKHIKGSKIDFDKAYFISQLDFDEINKRSQVNQWDVIISMIGEYCGFCYLEKEKNPDYAVKNVGLFKVDDRLKAQWLYYFINSRLGKFIIDSNKSGTSQPYITLGFLRGFPVLLPSNIEEMDSIVKILSSLDDKIELLHKQNETLEQTAETLFRQWFIEEAEEEWEILSFSEFADVTTGKGLKRNDFKDDGLYKVLGANGEIGKTNNYLYSDKVILTGRVGTLGKVVISNEKVWITDNVLIIKPKKDFYFYPIYFYMKRMDYESFNVGSTQPLMTQSDLKNTELITPTIDSFKKFNITVTPFFSKIKHNLSEIQTLTNLRDVLLPKLMSGEVRVKM